MRAAREKAAESSGTGSRDPVYDTIGLALSGGGIRSAVELQPHILNGLMTKHAAAINGVPGASLMALSAGLATIAGLFGNKLTWIVNQVTKDSSLWEKIKAVLIKVTLFLAALALPIILWLIYLQLCVWGIATDSPGQPSSSAPSRPWRDGRLRERVTSPA